MPNSQFWNWKFVVPDKLVVEVEVSNLVGLVVVGSVRPTLRYLQIINAFFKYCVSINSGMY